MSEDLKDMLPDGLVDPGAIELANSYIVAIVDAVYDKLTPFAGKLEGIMIRETELEVELTVELPDAVALLKAMPGVPVSYVEPLVNNEPLKYETDSVNGVRICSIDYPRRMCVLLLNLRRAT